MGAGSIVCPEESPPLFFSKSEYLSARAMVTVPSVSCQLWCPKVSKGRAGSPLVRPQAQALVPAGGLTRRLRRGSRACSPMGRSHFSFVGERKVCKRKPAARRLREKARYCPFLKEGVRNVARSTVGLPTFTFVRARAHSFPLSKRARLFPSAAYRRSAPAQSAVGMLTPCRLGSFNVVGGILQRG